MSFNIDAIITAIGNHRDRVALVAEHGGTVPAAYSKAEKRWDAWNEASNDQPMTALTDAYADGADETTLATLRAAALIAEVATPVQLAAVRNAPAPAAHAALRAAYAPQATKNYARVAEQYTAAAQEFTRLAQIIDPETDARHLVSADEDTRRAWLEAELIAGKLDTLATVLADAALLAGTSVKSEAAMIGLLTDPKSAHRRRVYEAWNGSGRCGRWSALIALDVDLRAADLDEHRPYREPRPIEKRHVRGNHGFYTIEIDPEDDGADDQLADGEEYVTIPAV